MTPPFTSRRLLYRIKKLASTFPDHDIRAGSFALDPDTRTLRRGETVVQLRPKEAASLALFMRHWGRVISRREIMKEVWETEYLGDADTINAHVRWLRLKVEDDPARPLYLRKVRGVGYRFDVPESSPDLTPAGTAL